MAAAVVRAPPGHDPAPRPEALTGRGHLAGEEAQRRAASRAGQHARREQAYQAALAALSAMVTVMTPLSVAVERRDLRIALSGAAGINTVLDLTVDGTVYPAIVKEMQRHPVKRNVTHVDFIQVNLDEAITVSVPLRLEGEAAPVGTTRVLELTAASQTFRFAGIGERPVPSLLRNFSAPVVVDFAYGDEALAFLAQTFGAVPPGGAPRDVVIAAVERTTRWAVRALAAPRARIRDRRGALVGAADHERHGQDPDRGDRDCAAALVRDAAATGASPPAPALPRPESVW